MSNAYYTIPGWGFAADFFKHLNLTPVSCNNFIPLDYCHLPTESLAVASETLAAQVKEQSTLIAWSMGGLIAINIAANWPEKVAKLVLIASQPKLVAEPGWAGIPAETAQQFTLDAVENLEKLQQQFLQWTNYPNRKPSVMKALKRDNIIQREKNCTALLPAFFAADLRPAYAKLDADVSHVVFEQDAVLSQDASALQQLNNRAKVMRIAGAGHAGMLSHPTEVEAAIAEMTKT